MALRSLRKLLAVVIAVLCLIEAVFGSARRLRDLPAALDPAAVDPKPVGTRSDHLRLLASRDVTSVIQTRVV